MALTREQFEQAYRERFFDRDKNLISYNYRTRRDESVVGRNLERTLWFYDLVIPSFDPQDRKIKICTTKKTGFPRIIGNADLLRRLFELNGGNLVNELRDADTGVYWGEYLCDSIPGDVSAIEFISLNVERRDITALLFYMGEQTQRHCIPHCGVAQDIIRLGDQGKKVLYFPLGYPYHFSGDPITLE